MLNKDFAIELCNHMEDRILELCEKMRTGNYNEASLPSFYMGLEADIVSYIEEKGLKLK